MNVLNYTDLSCGVAVSTTVGGHLPRSGVAGALQRLLLSLWENDMAKMDSAAGEREVWRQGKPYPAPAFILFSDSVFSIGIKSLGEAMKNFLEINNLGEVTASSPARNSNSGNDIIVYCYKVDRDAIQKFLASAT